MLKILRNILSSKTVAEILVSKFTDIFAVKALDLQTGNAGLLRGTISHLDLLLYEVFIF